MADAQNERTKGRNRRRRNRNSESTTIASPPDHKPVVAMTPEPSPPVMKAEKFVRPPEIAPPEVRSEEYCVHHMASRTECEPMQIRTEMTKIRHLQVDHFGEATLYCDCLHNGPHEWPPSMQILETAIELDQFVAASTKAE